MSAPEEATAPRPPSHESAPPRAELDVSKLHALPSEQQDLYLLTFTSDLVQYTVTLDNETLCAQQNFIKQELFKVLRLVSPVPSRVIRNGIGRCFGAVFTKGNRAILYDTVAELIGIVNSGKNEVDLKTKFAATVVLGDVFAAAGDGAVSQSGSACLAIIRLLKLAQNNVGLRCCIFSSLRKVVSGVGSSIDEATARDIWKHARNASVNDKAYNVQAASCVCLQELVRSTSYFRNTNDYEYLRTTLWKAMDSPIASVRHGAASCFAAYLVKAHSNVPLLDAKPTAFRSKKQLKRQPTDPVDGDIVERAQSPSARKTDNLLSFKMDDILLQLSSHYCKASTGNRTRAAIAVCYELLLKEFGGTVAEDNYAHIADHLLNTLINHPTVTYTRYRLLLTRKYVKHILEDVLNREMLHESSQLNAVQWLCNNILKDYPQVVPERREPSKYTLISALSALASLIESLGSAIATIAELCREALLQILQHPSFSVQVHIAHCMRNFVVACPKQLFSCVTVCMNSLVRELGQLSSIRMSAPRCRGYAYALSAILSTSRLQPLYGSVEIYAQVLTQATDLLKTSGDSELRVASTQIQVAWVLIGGLMPLGPNFTKIHLSQLLLLWKNALSPLAKESIAKRGPLEISFLAHVKECALSSILVFLEYNSKLITLDGSKRIAAMLQSTVQFLDQLPRLKAVEDMSQRLSPSLQLTDYATLVRRRVLQCFTKLVNLSHLNPMDNLPLSGILGLAISSFADPDVTSANPLETSIAATAGTFDTLWELDDNFGFGVTGLVRNFMPGEPKSSPFNKTSLTEATSHPVDSSLNTPMCQAREHDPILLFFTESTTSYDLPDPPSTGVVNSAIELFSVTLPLQNPKVQESSVEQIATLLSSHSLNRNPGRKAAMTANIALALLFTLRVAVNETPYLSGNLKHAAVEKIFQELIQTFLTNPDYIIRIIAFEALGRLCNNSGNAYTNSEINRLVDVIVENRDPHVRAGCAAALGSIHAQVGGMAAGFHLKTIVGVLMSLCNDPHPVVHFWALEGFVRVIDSAGLTFSAYVAAAFGMLARLYAADTHNREASTLGTSNFEAEFSTPLAIGRCVDALVNVIGPDLRDVTKMRDLVFTIVKEFQLERDAPLIDVSSQCLDHLSLYAPQYMDFSGYVQWLQKELASTDKQIQQAAVYGLSNLMKRGADRVVQTASSTFEDELWIAIDNAPENTLLKDIIHNWLQQTGLKDTIVWIERFQKVLTKTRTKRNDQVSQPPVTATSAGGPDLPDDEVAGFATAVAGDNREANDTSTGGQELLKWQTRNFVIGCLGELLTIVKGEILPDQTVPSETALQERIGDIVRMAFSASTANVIDLRIWGLKILDQVLKIFGRTPDPDFTEASLLEQYQAQIASALTPAFAADSSPELVSEAINVCATFVGTGIVTSVERMGRIFKLLVVGLENFASKPGMTEIGDLQGLNPNARVMVKLALYSAWARLQIISNEQNYLVDIVSPYTAMLTPLWLCSLQEFARLRFEPEISGTTDSLRFSDNPNDIYAALNREILLEFYQDSWLNFVDAIAILVEKDSNFVFDALNRKQDTQEPNSFGSDSSQDGELKAKENQINYQDEPVAFFFVLFGLAFDALISQSGSPPQILEILQALRKILHPSVAGNTIYQDAIFSETIDTLNRIVMTQNLTIQSVIVHIVRGLALHHPSATRDSSSTEHLSDDIEQLFELTRNIILVIAGVLPNLGESSPKARSDISEESIILIQQSLSSLVDITSVFPSVIRDDLHICIVHIFTTIFATGVCQADIVPKVLPIFKQFLQKLSRQSRKSLDTIRITPEEETTSASRQVQACLAKLLHILSVAQRRESDTSLSCAKNTLLGITILLTNTGSILQSHDPSITRAMQELLDCLQDRGLGSVAAGCIRSLLLKPNPRSGTDDVIARFLFPRLLAFVTQTPDRGNDIPIDPENTRSHIIQTLVTCLGSSQIPESAKPMALSLLVPTLLGRARREGYSVYRDTATCLLELAKIDQITFRGFIANMDPKSKSLVEEILRTVGSSDDPNKRSLHEQERVAPSITLRMDF